MELIEGWLVRVFRIALGLAFALLIVVVLIQVVGRAIGSSPIWTEELTRYALLYLVSIGAGLSLRSGHLVNVDIFCESVSETWSKRLRLVSAFLTAMLCAVLLVPASLFVKIGALQTSPAMGLQMTYVHFSVFALLFILFIFSALRIIGMIFRGEDGRAGSFKDIV